MSFFFIVMGYGDCQLEDACEESIILCSGSQLLILACWFQVIFLV